MGGWKSLAQGIWAMRLKLIGYFYACICAILLKHACTLCLSACILPIKVTWHCYLYFALEFMKNWSNKKIKESLIKHLIKLNEIQFLKWRIFYCFLLKLKQKCANNLKSIILLTSWSFKVKYSNYKQKSANNLKYIFLSLLEGQ